MSSFCNAKATHIFTAKNINVFAIFQNRNFNITLANNFVRFRTTGPSRLGILLNLYNSLGKFSRLHIDDIFLIFPRKQAMTFHANCLPWRQFAWNVKTCFLDKIKNIILSRLLKILPRVLSIKLLQEELFSWRINKGKLIMFSDLTRENTHFSIKHPLLQYKLLQGTYNKILENMSYPREKMYLLRCTSNKDSNQPAHSCSLIGLHWRHEGTTLRKHAYSNILRILQSKKGKFSDKKKSDIFSYFCSKHRLWVLVRTTSARQF